MWFFHSKAQEWRKFLVVFRCLFDMNMPNHPNTRKTLSRMRESLYANRDGIINSPAIYCLFQMNCLPSALKMRTEPTNNKVNKYILFHFFSVRAFISYSHLNHRVYCVKTTKKNFITYYKRRCGDSSTKDRISAHGKGVSFKISAKLCECVRFFIANGKHILHAKIHVAQLRYLYDMNRYIFFLFWCC